MNRIVRPPADPTSARRRFARATNSFHATGNGLTVEAAATLLHDRDVSRLPVVRDGRLVGIIARNDILRAILASD